MKIDNINLEKIINDEKKNKKIRNKKFIYFVALITYLILIVLFKIFN